MVRKIKLHLPRMDEVGSCSPVVEEKDETRRPPLGGRFAPEAIRRRGRWKGWPGLVFSSIHRPERKTHKDTQQFFDNSDRRC